MDKWEYAELTIGLFSGAVAFQKYGLEPVMRTENTIREALVSLGEEGWEAYTVAVGSELIYLKRRIPDATTTKSCGCNGSCQES